MNTRDEGRTSLVEFLRSIKFAHENTSNRHIECPTHFAHFEQRARGNGQVCAEDSQVIRSAN
jgi:hypothetical protein